MAHNKLYRSFIILQENEKGHSIAQDKPLSGYAKIEAKNEKCKIAFYVQNLKKDYSQCYMILICNKKDGKCNVNIGPVNINSQGKAEMSMEYDGDNIGDYGINYDKVIGAALYKDVSGKTVYLMCGFLNGEQPKDNWKNYKMIEGKKMQDKKSESHSDKKKEFISDKKLENKDSKKSHDKKYEYTKENKHKHDDHDDKYDHYKKHHHHDDDDCEDHDDCGNYHDNCDDNYDDYDDHDKHKHDDYDKKHSNDKKKDYGFEEDYKHKDYDCDNNYEDKEYRSKKESNSLENKFDDYEKEIEIAKNNEDNIDIDDFELRGSMGDFFLGIVSEFDPIKGFGKDIKNCKWYKVKVDNFDDMCNISNYNKYTVIYYPMINYYPYISKKGYFYVGLKCDKNGVVKYIVYAIPGTKDRRDQPYGGRTGFVTWVPDNPGDKEGNWLMFYDFQNSMVVVPMK